MLESGVELVGRVEAAWDFNRIPDSRTPGRLASDRDLHQLSRHFPKGNHRLGSVPIVGAIA